MIVEIESIDDPRLQCFASLTEAQLRSGFETQGPLFIIESPKVIKVALEKGYSPRAILCERRHIEGDAAEIIASCPDAAVYTGTREMLASLTGYKLTRGVLCAMERMEQPPVEEVCRDARRVVVIENVVDTTNIGAIFRSAAALGIDAVLLTRDTCDPFNRRSVRVSMGSVFLVPWTWIDSPVETLRPLGFKIASMALCDNSVSIDDEALRHEAKLAIVMGSEGDGLPAATIENSDYVVKIPMSHNVDSLNVAAAAAVAFWELRARQS